MALREINLVPNDVVERRRGARHIRAWAAALAVLACSVGSAYAAFHYGVLSRRQPGVTPQNLRKQVAATVAQIYSAQEELDRLVFLGRITPSPLYWETLGWLSEVMGSGTWLTSLRLSDNGDAASGADLILTGLSLTNADLGTFMRHLSGNSAFRDVALQFSKQTQIVSPGQSRPATAIQFEIRCGVGGK